MSLSINSNPYSNAAVGGSQSPVSANNQRQVETEKIQRNTVSDSYEPSGSSVANGTSKDLSISASAEAEVDVSAGLGGIGDCLSGVCEMVMNLVTGLFSAAASVLKAAAEGIVCLVSDIFNAICGAFSCVFGDEEAKPLDEECDEGDVGVGGAGGTEEGPGEDGVPEPIV